MKNLNLPTKEIIVCECFSTEHQVAITYIQADNKDEADEMCFEVHLTPGKGFFKRIIGAIKYVFGYRSRYGDWDEFIFNPKDCEKLILYLQELKNSNRDRTDKLGNLK